MVALLLKFGSCGGITALLLTVLQWLWHWSHCDSSEIILAYSIIADSLAVIVALVNMTVQNLWWHYSIIADSLAVFVAY